MKTGKFFYSTERSNCNDVDWYVVSGKIMNSSSLSCGQRERALKLLDRINDLVDNFEDTEDGGAFRTVDWLDADSVETFLVTDLSKDFAPRLVNCRHDRAKELLEKFESELPVIAFLAGAIASSRMTHEGLEAERKRAKDCPYSGLYGWSYYHRWED